MNTELTEDEMKKLGWSKSADLYLKEMDGAIVYADALPNGNAPVGGQHYNILEPDSPSIN